MTMTKGFFYGIGSLIIFNAFILKADDTPAQAPQNPAPTQPAPAVIDPAPTVALLLSVDQINKNPTRKKEFIELAKEKLADTDATTLSAIIHLLQVWPESAQDLCQDALKKRNLSSLLVEVLDIYNDGFASDYSLNEDDDEGTLITPSMFEYFLLPTAIHGALTLIKNDFTFGRKLVNLADRYEQHGLMKDENMDDFLTEMEDIRKMHGSIRFPVKAFAASLPGALINNAISLAASKKILELANQATGNYLKCPRYSRRKDNTEYYVCTAARFAAEQGVAALVRSYVTTPVIGSVLPLRAN